MNTPAEYQFRATYPQSFHNQFQEASAAGRVRVQIGGMEDQDAAFKRVVKKEPAKYACKHPFRGVAKLGGQDFAFAFDAVGTKPDDTEEKEKKAKEEAEKKAAEEKEKKSKSSLLDSLSRALVGEESASTPARPGKAIVYNRFYFDRNHNGDLTDDKVIEPEPSGERYYSANYARAQFPVVTVSLEADGTKYDYSFTVNVTYQAMNDQMAYAWASFNAAAYREGEITLDGKKHHVAVIDFNSNGRFDDVMKLRDVRSRGGEVYPEYGDVLLLDPDATLPVYLNPYEMSSSGNRYNVSKLVSIEGKYYDLTISPSGDKLRFTAATPSLGYVTNPNDGFAAVVYSDKGFLKIRGEKSKPVPLPEGSWKLLSYTIERTGTESEKPAAEAPAKKEGQKQQTLLESLLKAAAGTATMASPVRQVRITTVTAQATLDYKAVEVRKGETAVLPFGPPYKPVVRVDYVSGPGQVRLGMTLVGSAGERCTNMMVRGSRPSKPEFTVSNPKGEVVYRGTFEYG